MSDLVNIKPLEFPPTCPRGQRVHSRPQALIRYTIAHYAGDDGNAVYRWASESESWSEPHNSYGEAAKGCARADYEDRVRAVFDDTESATELTRLRSLNAECEAALGPLGKIADAVFDDGMNASKPDDAPLYGFDGAYLTYGDLRRARAPLLARANGGGNA